jgi:hypothetical protein
VIIEANAGIALGHLRQQVQEHSQRAGNASALGAGLLTSLFYTTVT